MFQLLNNSVKTVLEEEYEQQKTETETKAWLTSAMCVFVDVLLSQIKSGHCSHG